MRTLSLHRARRLVLTSLGLARGRPDARSVRDVRHLRRVLEAVRVVQIDSVNVLVRAHELPFWSRLGAHDRVHRDHWLWRSGEVFDGWAHVASLAPVRVWPWLHHRRAAARPGGSLRAHLAEDPHLLERVHAEVAASGPVSVRGLADPGTRSGPWWGNPRGKVALDHLAASGRLAIRERDARFVTMYDLTERVLPPDVLDTEHPGEDRAAELLLLAALRAQGLGTADHLADHHRQRLLPARAALERLTARGEVEEIRISGWGDLPVYLDPAAVTTRNSRARTLVAPFDPLVWHRARTEALFGFRYRIEIYVPEAERVHGYYVLPFLLGDRLVARVDLKADRARRRLRVRSAFAEAGVDRVHVARELAAELHELAAWLGCTEVEVEERGDLAARLARAVGNG
ncbi:MAG: crosslink repair DNA glycosylase YcaQ family protein [Nitriliruptoraceae bacterium]